MKVKVICRKFEYRKDIHYKTQTGTSCEKCNSKAFQLGIEPYNSLIHNDLYIYVIVYLIYMANKPK